MGTRRHARELALTVLFETEFQPGADAASIARIAVDENPGEDALSFLKELLASYRAHAVAVNAAIETHSNNWKISRMALVDRNILRLGAAEILNFADIPKNVTINEYLEIAKKYGTEDSSGFINGILDKIVKPA